MRLAASACILFKSTTPLIQFYGAVIVVLSAFFSFIEMKQNPDFILMLSPLNVHSTTYWFVFLFSRDIGRPFFQKNKNMFTRMYDKRHFYKNAAKKTLSCLTLITIHTKWKHSARRWTGRLFVMHFCSCVCRLNATMKTMR